MFRCALPWVNVRAEWGCKLNFNVNGCGSAGCKACELARRKRDENLEVTSEGPP